MAQRMRVRWAIVGWLAAGTLVQACGQAAGGGDDSAGSVTPGEDGAAGEVVGDNDATLQDDSSAGDVTPLPRSDGGSSSSDGSGADSTRSGSDGAAADAHGDSGSAGGSDAAIGCTGGGCPCQGGSTCDSGVCLEVDGQQQCAALCASGCAEGFKCTQVAGSGGDLISVCTPATPRLCEPCAADSDCNNVLGGADNRCVPYNDASGSLLGNFCASPCNAGLPCPSGYACQDKTSLGGVKSAVCVKQDLVCPCSNRAKKLGLATACSNAAAAGTCGGKRVCGDNGLSACDAPTAQAETCNKKDDNCNGETDEKAPGLCDDGLFCTYDNCIGGECQHPGKTGPCDDGNACTNSELCSDGLCKGTAITCDDKNPCSQDACDPAKGCVATPDDQAACSDGNGCTTGDQCQGGVCLAGAPTSCDDGNACTIDSCDVKLGCQHKPTAVVCNDGNPCTTDLCDALVGCTSVPNSAKCSDGSVCTDNDACADGVCQPGSYKDCEDGNPCTANACDPKKGCTSISNSAACDDGNLCTQLDVCKDGACKGGAAKGCDDGNPCTTDLCDAAKGCLAVSNAEPCSDNNICTEGDQCSGGQCKAGKPKLCNDGNPCTTDFCDDQKGCDQAANTAPCDDGSVCTVGDVCQSGSCVPGNLLNCDDGNPCTNDGCDGLQGCFKIANAAPCTDGNLCTTGDTCAQGACLPTGLQLCDDGNPCTLDVCNPKLGCTYPDSTAPCDDGSVCTLGDICQGGACKPGLAVTCNDGNPCTDDACDPKKGCAATPNTAACNDGNDCTQNDVCNGGVCSGGFACHSNALCGPGVKAPTCQCKPGFSGDGLSCTDIDECALGTAGCNANATCTNTPGSFTCTCKAGYEGDGKTCTDINECLSNNGGCGANSACSNTPGSYNCACNAGFLNCDGAPGCEIDGNTNKDNCGGCGKVCASTCTAGVCGPITLTKWSEGTQQWPDQACNPTNSFGGCNTNAQDHADAWATFVCKQNGWTKGVWTGQKAGGCNGQVSMYCGGQIPCAAQWEYSCSPSDQTKVQVTCSK